MLKNNMKKKSILFLAVLGLITAVIAGYCDDTKSPFKYAWAKAYHVLAETHNNESGYFSLCEGLDGNIYVGTAKYNENSYLVEFNPVKETQKVVIDTHKVCGLNAKGYSAQSKIHTRNFTGQSGKIYVGSKQGYRSQGDSSEYQGGYVMTYDPRTGIAENLGMPLPGSGIIDVAADEKRGLLYVVTCEDQHWMVGDIKTKQYRDLGTILVSYATTLIDNKGRAHAITKDFQLATYNPENKQITVRDIIVNKKKYSNPAENKGYAIPCWNISGDGKTAYMNLLSYPELIEIDLSSEGSSVSAKNHGLMIDGKGHDSRGALCIGPDENVYCLIRVDNTTGFGTGYLHHLVRFLTKENKMEDLGVLAVRNPDFFDFGAGKPWSHGYHKLPDSILTPLYSHMAMIVANDGTIYVTIIYPFTLLRVDGLVERMNDIKRNQLAFPAEQYISAVLKACDGVESGIPEITKVAEVIAERHINGGLLGFEPIPYQGLQDELWGRSGGFVHMGFERYFKKDRTDTEKQLDVSFIGWQRAPFANEIGRLKKMREEGRYYIVGFGPKEMPELAEHVKNCDVWFNTGFDTDDRVVTLPDGSRAGRINHLVNALNGWALNAEIVSALTRKGRMPTMAKSYCYENGPEWYMRYLYKKQFHDEYNITPVPAGELAQTFIDRIRHHVKKFERTQLGNVEKTVELILEELKNREKVFVTPMGHMPWTYVGKYEDSRWCVNVDMHSNITQQVENYKKKTDDACAILRLGYAGLDGESKKIFEEKKQKVMLVSAENERQGWEIPEDIASYVDMGYAFGDACVSIEGYPIRLFPPSGIMQVVAYECINVEVLSALADRKEKEK